MTTEASSTAMHARYRVGIDIGGTFTDLTLADDDGIVAVGKVLTTSAEPARAIEEVLRVALEETGIPASELDWIVHGTTIVTNAIIERKGAATALLTTEGFRDIVEMGHERRYELYDLMIELPKPLVPRHLRFDIPERTLSDGQIEQALDAGYVERLAKELERADIRAVAIAFLHSYANPTNERAARDIIERVGPSIRVAISSEVVPEIREYERSSTTIASVYVQERVADYLNDLERRLDQVGVDGPLYVMHSNGGIATVDTSKRFPIRMLESGPAAGALGAAAIGGESGRKDLLSFDMGGTTAKLCMIENGQPLVTQEFEVDRVYRLRPGSGLPVKTPVIDMIEIGVGGGSIARINPLGLLTVGPDSAGSDPGPVCYGLGGTRPTVTDADLVLGYLNPAYFLGGRMTLDLEAARQALQTEIAEPLGVSVEEAAWGIHRSVNEDMANAARVHAVERGRDPSSLPMYAFGGAGPVHGAGVAQAVGCPTLIAPVAAGVMSSAGCLTAPLAFDFVRSSHVTLAGATWTDVDGIFTEMERAGTELLRTSGVHPGEVSCVRSADMRYVGQGFEINVPATPSETSWPQSLRDAFEATYEKLYGRRGPDVEIEILNWRVVCSGPRPTVRIRPTASSASGTASRKGQRIAYFGEFVETPVYDRYAMAPGDKLLGPAIIEERESTLVAPPGSHVIVDHSGGLEMDLQVERTAGSSQEPK